MKRLVVDASAILKAFFPDEECQTASQALIRDWVEGRIELIAPSLLYLELTNAVLVAVRRGRISKEKAHEIIRALEGLSIPVKDPLDIDEVFDLAVKFNLSAYDAAYVALAVSPFVLITGDKGLYRAMKQKRKAVWVGDYR